MHEHRNEEIYGDPREVALAVALAVFTRFLDMVLNPSRIDDND